MSGSLAYETHGRGPPVVLLHGYGASRFTWRHWVPDLRRDHRLVVPDLLGHGRSPTQPRDAFGPEAQAERAVQLLLGEDLSGVVLAGHSLGGGVALLAALLLADRGESDRLRGVVIISGAAYPQRIPPFVRLARKGALARLALALTPKRLLIRTVLRSIVADPARITPAQVQGYAGPWLDRDTRRGMFETAVDIVPGDLGRWTARFSEIDRPALLLWGREDPVVPLSVGARLESELPRARLVVLERCGHIPHEERPGASLAEVRRFLDGLGG